MSAVKTSLDLAINAAGNAFSAVANLNNNFDRTFNILGGVENKIDAVSSQLTASAQINPFEKIGTGFFLLNSALEVVTKIAPAIMSAANAANVLEANINKAALSNMRLVQGLDGGYNNLSQNVTKFGNDAMKAAIKAGDGLDDVLKVSSQLSQGGISQDVAFNIYSNVSAYAKGFQTEAEKITGIYSGLNSLKSIDITNEAAIKNAMNGIQYAMSASKVSIDEYSKMLKDNAPQFNAFGYSIDDINKMMLSLADSGFSGNNIIQNIEQINKAMLKAQKTGKGIELNGEALLAYNVLVNKTGKDIERIDKGLKAAQANDYVGKIAAQVAGTNSDRISTMFNQIKAVGAVFLSVFIPIVAFALDIIQPFFDLALNLFKPVQWLIALITENFDFLFPILAGGIAAVSLAFAPVIAGFILVVGLVKLISDGIGYINELIDEGSALGYVLAGALGVVAAITGVILIRQLAVNAAAAIGVALSKAKSVWDGVILAIQKVMQLTNPFGWITLAIAGVIALIGLVGKLFGMGKKKKNEGLPDLPLPNTEQLGIPNDSNLSIPNMDGLKIPAIDNPAGLNMPENVKNSGKGLATSNGGGESVKNIRTVIELNLNAPKGYTMSDDRGNSNVQQITRSLVLS